MPIKINSTGGGSVSIDVPSTGGTYTLTAPANNATIFTTDGGAITGNVGFSGVVSFSSNNVSIGGQTVSPFTGMKNRVINGDMRVWQRGTSHANTTTYTADRWFVNRNGGVSGVTVSQSGSIGNYFLKVQRQASTTATNNSDVRQVIESLNCADLAGQNVTLSFNCYKGANFSGSSVTAEIRYSTATDDLVNIVGSWASGGSSGITPTTTSTRYSLTVSIPANAATLMVRFVTDAYSGTAGADDSIYYNNVQLEAGSLATPFERRLYSQELHLCQRYYWQSETISFFYAAGAGQMHAPIQFPVTMRTTPTMTYYPSVADMYARTNAGYALRDGVGNVAVGNVNSGVDLDSVYYGVSQANNLRVARTASAEL